MQTRSRLIAILRIVWILVTLLTLALVINGIPMRWLDLVNGADRRALGDLGLTAESYAAYLTTLDLVVVLTHIIIAAIIFWRRSSERVALFVAFALVTGGAMIPLTLMYTLAESQLPPQMLAHLIIFGGLVTGVLLLYRFPDGRWVPRWTFFLSILWAILALTAIFAPNAPFSMPRWTIAAQLFALLIFSGTGVFAQIYRYQNVSVPAQRQQTKWAIVGLTAAALGPFAYFLPFVILSSNSGPAPSNFVYQRIGANFFALSIYGRLTASTLVDVALLLFPLSFAFAILRYRLWDIDIIIRRTLIYSALTGAIILLYFVLGILLQQLFNFITGHQQSEIVTVLTTLAVAALFIPLRDRVQEIIDRRFYRHKYDATQTLTAFGAALRDEVDLQHLTEQLLNVVEETMQPAHVSLWLKQQVKKK